MFTRIAILFLLLNNQACLSQVDSVFFENQSMEKTSFSGVPILSYDNDIGLRYGAIANYFKYNDSTSNAYSENLYLKAFNTTRNSLQVQSLYETDNLFKNSKTYIEASYLKDKSYDFFGFNGSQAVHNPAFEDSLHSEHIHPNFYGINRELIRFRFDYQRALRSPKYRALLGFTMNKVNIRQNLNENNLYSQYANMHLISDKEIKGGYANYFSLGLIYDYRNNQCYCSEGKWIESFVVLSPKFMNAQSFSKFILTYRTYKEFSKQKYVLMFRSSVQFRTSGTVPTYLKSTYFDTKLNQDGLGGAFNLRGFNRNRIMADGFGLLNLEVRKNLLQLKIKKTKMDVDVSLFSDNALIIQEHRIDKSLIPPETSAVLFDFNYEKHYSTVGIGSYIVLNKNSVISLNFGLPVILNTRGALYIGSSFLF
jgi:hypothetical protein